MIWGREFRRFPESHSWWNISSQFAHNPGVISYQFTVEHAHSSPWFIDFGQGLKVLIQITADLSLQRSFKKTITVFSIAIFVHRFPSVFPWFFHRFPMGFSIVFPWVFPIVSAIVQGTDRPGRPTMALPPAPTARDRWAGRIPRTSHVWRAGRGHPRGISWIFKDLIMNLPWKMDENGNDGYQTIMVNIWLIYG